MPSAKKAADPSKPKRPMNAFMMFANEKRPQHQKDYPELKMTEISKMLGEEWRSLSDDEKSPYTKEAKRLKAIYEKTKSACECACSLCYYIQDMDLKFYFKDYDARLVCI